MKMTIANGKTEAWKAAYFYNDKGQKFAHIGLVFEREYRKKGIILFGSFFSKSLRINILPLVPFKFERKMEILKTWNKIVYILGYKIDERYPTNKTVNSW